MPLAVLARVGRCQLLYALLMAWSFASQAAEASAPQAGYPDPERAARVAALLPEIDLLYADLAAKEHLPGLVYGIVLDGKLIHTHGLGYTNLEQQLPVTSSSRFRIASMTKSFVAMAVLRLRDEGKLRLDDTVARYLPEFARLHPATADAPAITIRHLLTMSSGLPEDNPWGDRQMELNNAALAKFVGGGLAFSSATGSQFEYSNLGFVMLGKLVSKVSGMRFQDYISQRILQPLGMNDSAWEYARVPAAQLAMGYRWSGSGWELEPMLHDGDAAAMGGLITTADDFARYIALLQSAWPARSDADTGPLRRASLREMQAPQAFIGLSAKNTLLDGSTANPKVTFYSYGLAWSRDSRDVVVVAHSGGLPGFGSIYLFAPNHGIGVFAFSNLRYAPVNAPTTKVLNLLLETGALPARPVAPSELLLERQRQVVELLQNWDGAAAAALTADNFFLDRSRADWVEYAGKQLAGIGKISSVGALSAENQLRGSFPLLGERGTLQVSFTLTPERVPKVQALKLVPLPSP